MSVTIVLATTEKEAYVFHALNEDGWCVEIASQMNTDMLHGNIDVIGVSI
jgi:hypothetical protein